MSFYDSVFCSVFLVPLFIFRFLVELREEVVECLFLHVAELVFLFGILAYLGYPCAACRNVVLSYAFGIVGSYDVQPIVVAHQLVSPCPAVFLVVAVYFAESLQHLSNCLESAVLHVVYESFLLAFGHEHSRQVCPFARAGIG